MKINTFLITLLCYVLSFTFLLAQDALHYEIDLNDRSDDSFKVKLRVKNLGPENDIYQFASTAPGTYQVMDIGRYVRNFTVLDKKGKEISTEKISTNQWKISQPEKVAEIQYHIAETWDTPVEEHNIYLMCGSSLEEDHALINGQTVFGYPQGMQNTPLAIAIKYPENWLVGTALEKNQTGEFLADDYDHIVDSPILLGRLTQASTQVQGANIEIYTYSKTDKIQSEQLLGAMQEMLNAAGAFIEDFPVDRYTFLFHFEDKGAGAWEHSYSSEYVMQEVDYTAEYGQKITDIAAHEFFHVITPLNIHSEIIEDFDFVTPTPSQHLWLYEGTTEWASHIMQLRYDGLYNLEDYLAVLAQKVFVDRKFFDQDYSLVKLSKTSYTPEGQKQYGNIYYRGALVAGLLDIRLLELSGGKKGLREVINELAQKYGKEKAFPEEDFFKIFTEMTYPEIADFFDKYVKNANPLPHEEYYGKLGFEFKEGEDGRYSFVPNPDATEEQLALRAAWMKNL